MTSRGAVPAAIAGMSRSRVWQMSVDHLIEPVQVVVDRYGFLDRSRCG